MNATFNVMASELIDDINGVRVLVSGVGASSALHKSVA